MKALVIAIVLALAATAHAYPQFELSHDQTCSGCHISPAGGGLLGENGLNVAENISTFGTDPAFLNGIVKTPDWLMLGGDFRGATGYLQAPQRYLLGIPMQADVYGHVTLPKGFSLQVTVGYRPPENGNETVTHVWSREHYVMWQSEPGSPEGLFVRVGRFMPTFGLRLAEHTTYIRRYGGTPLYGDTYGVAADYIKQQYEAHVTGFIRDRLIDTVEHNSGAAALVQYRPTANSEVGAEGMVQVSPDDSHYRGGVLGKYYFDGPAVLLMGEVQVVNQHIGSYGLTQIVSQLMATWFIRHDVMLDLGWGHYDENLRIKGLDRDAIDMNLHWFTTSHFEAVLNTRVELIGQASSDPNTSGPTGAYVLLMGHYRL